MIIAFKDAWLTSLLGCWHSVRASEGEATALNALSTTPSPPNTTRWGVGFSRGAQSYYCDLYLPLGFDWTRSDLCGGGISVAVISSLGGTRHFAVSWVSLFAVTTDCDPQEVNTCCESGTTCIFMFARCTSLWWWPAVGCTISDTFSFLIT